MSDKARLLHVLVILFIVIWISNRNISRIIIQYSSKGYRRNGYIILSKNICMKSTTTVLTDRFHMSAYVNGLLYDIVLTFSYFMALQARYWQDLHFLNILFTPSFLTGNIMAFKESTRMLLDLDWVTSMLLSLHNLVLPFLVWNCLFYKPIEKILDWKKFLISGGREMSLKYYVGRKISLSLL